MKKPYDPNLREAMEEIKAVLKKHDCMGAIILVSPTHSEFLFHPEASWSVVHFEDDPDGPQGAQMIRIRSKRADFPSKEAQRAANEASVHAIESIRWLSLKTHELFTRITGMLRTQMTILTDAKLIDGEPDSVPGDDK
jgi:hypothetical protein